MRNSPQNARQQSQGSTPRGGHFTIRTPTGTQQSSSSSSSLSSRPRMPTPKNSYQKTLPTNTTTTTTTTNTSITRRESKSGSPTKSPAKKRVPSSLTSPPTPPPHIDTRKPMPTLSESTSHLPGSISNMTPNLQSKLKIKAIEIQNDADNIENATIPLGAVLHILRERRKDSLNVQCLIYLMFLLLYTAVANLHHNILDSYSQNFGIREMLLNEPFNEPDDLRNYHDVGKYMYYMYPQYFPTHQPTMY
jgi:hypothetical protein